MNNVVINDMRDYAGKYRKQILLSVIAAVVCYGFLVFSGNIRIDTEELINHPGTKLGWLTIGRFGLAFLKDVLGLGTHSAVKSGIMFFVFFLLGANLLCCAIWHFSGKHDYPYWIFLLLYVTSNIWSYQIYFSVQQAEVACAMFLLIAAGICAMQACFEKCGIARVWRSLVAITLLVLGLGAYQALAAYYVAVCLVLFLAWMEGYEAGVTELSESDAKTDTGAVKKKRNRRIICGIVGLLVTFGVAYVIYSMIAKTWFMATADYMGDQMGWGKYSALDCIKNVLRTVKNLVLGIGPRNFSFYTAGLLLVGILLIAEWRRCRRGGRKPDLQLGLKVLAIIGLAASPFLMTIYMGEMLVTRSQFALPVAAAFLGMYGIAGLHRQAECEMNAAEAKVDRGQQIMRFLAKTGMVCAVLAIVWQCAYNLRLTYTDNQRFASDAAKTEQLAESLREANGGELPTQPVIFVGYQEPELPGMCRRTEMYGWSFYGWDYSEENPTGPTHRIIGFVQAYTGIQLNEEADEVQKQRALKLAEQLSDFPSDGSIAVTDELVVVRLSGVCEREMSDWW